MANLKASKKDIRRTARRTTRNMQMSVALDKAVKSLLKKPETGAVNKVYSILDKMTSRGFIKKNTAARQKAKLAKKANV